MDQFPSGVTKPGIKAYSGNPADEWYLPFSMADDDDMEPRSFPMRRSRASMDKVVKLVQNLI